MQSNKVKKVTSVPNLFVVETVDSAKLATSLNNAWATAEKPNETKLNVMVQINTSGEKGKYFF